MILKVGEKFKVRKDLQLDRRYGDGILFPSEMSKYLGQTLIVSELGDNRYFVYDRTLQRRWAFCEDMIDSQFKFGR